MKKLTEYDKDVATPTEDEIAAAYERLKPGIDIGKDLYQEFLKLQAEDKLGEIKRDIK